MPLDPSLVFVAMVPDRALPTAKARQVLPAQVSREDATFNLGRMGMLLAGLADHRMLVREATEDRLHQDYRSPLFPEAPMLLASLVGGGALAACWSGAGPSLLGDHHRGPASAPSRPPPARGCVRRGWRAGCWGCAPTWWAW